MQDDKPFVSAKKVLGDLGGPYADSVELASFHTVSKGVLGECGLRGGYVELTNFHPGTVDELYKVRGWWGWGGGGGEGEAWRAPDSLRRNSRHAQSCPCLIGWPVQRTCLCRRPAPAPPRAQAVSINLCPNTVGQVGVSLMVNPPKAGEESFEEWKREQEEGLASLRRRAHAMTDGFNALEGVTCTFTEGAM